MAEMGMKFSRFMLRVLRTGMKTNIMSYSVKKALIKDKETMNGIYRAYQ